MADENSLPFHVSATECAPTAMAGVMHEISVVLILCAA